MIIQLYSGTVRDYCLSLIYTPDRKLYFKRGEQVLENEENVIKHLPKDVEVIDGYQQVLIGKNKALLECLLAINICGAVNCTLITDYFCGVNSNSTREAIKSINRAMSLVSTTYNTIDTSQLEMDVKYLLTLVNSKFNNLAEVYNNTFNCMANEEKECGKCNMCKSKKKLFKDLGYEVDVQDKTKKKE